MNETTINIHRRRIARIRDYLDKFEAQIQTETVDHLSKISTLEIIADGIFYLADEYEAHLDVPCDIMTREPMKTTWMHEQHPIKGG